MLSKLAAGPRHRRCAMRACVPLDGPVLARARLKTAILGGANALACRTTSWPLADPGSPTRPCCCGPHPIYGSHLNNRLVWASGGAYSHRKGTWMPVRLTTPRGAGRSCAGETIQEVSAIGGGFAASAAPPNSVLQVWSGSVKAALLLEWRSSWKPSFDRPGEVAC
jgi:hypothetical protein